ncbi:MAG: type IV secretory system conjugative DNA transfer family protein [Gemmatimonadota bacterium]
MPRRPSPPITESLDPPEALPGEGILVGYSLEHERRTAPIGFTYGASREGDGPVPGRRGPTLDPILHTGGGHLMTIAPTGGGKGVGCIVPALLRFPGPVIVIDPKGENVAVTAARRRSLGQRVVVLDPLGITRSEDAGALNPLDLVEPGEDGAIDDAASLAALLGGGREREDPRNVFWYERGRQLLTGIVQFVAVERPSGDRDLAEVRRILNLPTHAFLELAGTEMLQCPDAEVRQVAGTLANPAEEMIGSILSMAQNSLGFLRGPRVQESTGRSSFDLADVTRGEPLSIFIVIPPDKLESHRNLLRLWIGTLMAALMRRRAPVPHPTLFVLDEAAQLGPLDPLRQAITLMRGYGLQTWSFWQDVSQLRNLYPRDWETMFNNCRVHQAFGLTTLHGAGTACELMGFHDSIEALRLDADEMILSISGDEAVIAQKPNYLTDPAFQGLYSPNPFYTKSSDEPPTPRRARRLYVRPAWEGSVAEDPGDGGRNDGEEDEEERAVAVGAPEADGVEGAVDRDAGVGLAGVFEARAGGDDGLAGATRWLGSALEPLPGTEVPLAWEVPELLDLLADHAGGSWNPATTRVRGLELPFYPDHVLIEACDPLRAPSRILGLKVGAGVRAFEAGLHGLRTLNRDVPVRLDDATVPAYVRFFLHFTRFGTPGLRLVESLEQLAFWTGASPDALAAFDERVDPVRVERTPGADASPANAWRVRATVLVGDALQKVDLRVRPDGEVVETSRVHRAHPLPMPPGYPEVRMPGAPEGSPEPYAEVHGRWHALSGPEGRAVLRDLPAGGDAGPDPILLRRSVPCYPSTDLLAVRARDASSVRFFFYRPGSCHPVSGETLWNSGRNPFGREHLGIRDVGSAEAYLRIYLWYGSNPEEHWLVLEAFDHVPLRPGATFDDADRKALRSQWSRVMALPLGEDDAETVAGRFQVMVLHGSEAALARLVVEGDGDVRMEESVVYPVELPVDEARVRSLLVLPSLGPDRDPGGVAVGEPSAPGEGE